MKIWNKTLKDVQCVPVKDVTTTLNRIWCIGGQQGWYYADFLWQLRGRLDELSGGPGVRRGRAHPTELQPGDTLDCWRVLLADKDRGQLLLAAEMKVPGKAWLEFRLVRQHGQPCLLQTAAFIPHGIMGYLYWYAMAPFHYFIFRQMARRLAAV